MLVPLAIINHFKPTRELPGMKQLHELYPLGTEHKDFTLPRDPRFFAWRNFFLRADHAIKIDFQARLAADAQTRAGRSGTMDGGANRAKGATDSPPCSRPCSMLDRTAGAWLFRATSIYEKAAKDFAGLFVDDPEDFRIQPCLSPVWDTSINIIALAESGIPAEHPALKKAATWLVEKEVRICGDWTMNNPHPEASGWAFEYNNVYYPDTDDTAMVLMALRLARPEDQPAFDALFRRAIAWQLSFQCRDGGWAAFDKEITKHWLEDMPFADHNAILDPTCSDLTARTLELLGYIGFDAYKRSVRDAVRHLIDTQDDDGSWYGRWGVNYIYGTWQVLRGLRAIGENMTQDWILRGRDWLESCQNDDGGWGETCVSYETPVLKGKGESTASQTAWALMGICACGDLDRPSVQRGLRYLLSMQRPDGTWEEPQITGTGFPRVFYLKYDMYRQNFPLLALATYINYRSGLGHYPSFYRC